MSLPSADDLFRPTAAPRTSTAETDPAPAGSPDGPKTGGADDSAAPRRAGRSPSGRVRHDEKVTVYMTAAELLDLEHARLLLRGDHGLAVDRGRLIRAAVAIALADFEANGDDSVIVQRLTRS